MGIIPSSTVVGVFENRLQAEQAIEELHHAGFTDDQISYKLGSEPEEHNESNNGRTIVAVKVGEDAQRANEAREILHRHGAFDAYTPFAEGTKHGAISGNDAADTTYPDHGVAGNSTESFFAEPVGMDPRVPGTLESPDLRGPRVGNEPQIPGTQPPSERPLP